MIELDPHLISDIKRAEGCKLTAYRDTEGFWTIGWGHLLPAQLQDWSGTLWTQAQADAQLDSDIALAITFAQSLMEWPSLDTSCRQNAVSELCFNLRRKWLAFVKTRSAIQAGDWEGAHDGLLASLWAKQVHAARANRIANYLLTGAYPV